MAISTLVMLKNIVQASSLSPQALLPNMHLQKWLFLWTLIPCITYVHAVNFTGLYSLIKRQIPQHAGHIVFGTLEGRGDKYTMQNTPGVKGSVTISCTSLSACARGIYTYVIL